MRNRKKLASGIWITALSAAFAPSAGAAPLTFEFGGVIDFVEDGLPISDQVAVGMPYAAVYQFDPQEANDALPSPQFGSYQFAIDAYMDVSIGALNISTPDLLVFIENSSFLDAYQVSNLSEFVSHSISWQGVGLDLRDATHSVFDSDALPLTAPDLGDFQFTRRFVMREIDHRFPSITGTVTYLNMIPEPSSLATLFATLAVVSLRRCRSHRLAIHTKREP